ncbi:hypothetical protein BKA01_004993 [Pseudonocardia eucalypti]|nr:hypothetical protein [Pseudonocardia eucalypti]
MCLAPLATSGTALAAVLFSDSTHQLVTPNSDGQLCRLANIRPVS